MKKNSASTLETAFLVSRKGHAFRVSECVPAHESDLFLKRYFSQKKSIETGSQCSDDRERDSQSFFESSLHTYRQQVVCKAKEENQVRSEAGKFCFRAARSEFFPAQTTN